MKLSSTIPLFALLVATGCRESQDKSAASHEAPALGPQFSAKSGLLLPGSTCQALDLKIVEVGEQKLSATLSVQLQVYERVASGLRAVALLTPEQAKGLKRGQPIEVQIRDGQTLVGKVT